MCGKIKGKSGDLRRLKWLGEQYDHRCSDASARLENVQLAEADRVQNNEMSRIDVPVNFTTTTRVALSQCNKHLDSSTAIASNAVGQSKGDARCKAEM
jgi:hypothetical protein